VSASGSPITITRDGRHTAPAGRIEHRQPANQIGEQRAEHYRLLPQTGARIAARQSKQVTNQTTQPRTPRDKILNHRDTIGLRDRRLPLQQTKVAADAGQRRAQLFARHRPQSGVAHECGL